MRDQQFDVQGSKFRKPHTSDLEVSPCSFQRGLRVYSRHAHTHESGALREEIGERGRHGH